jgi:regulatory protein NPR1
MEPSSSITFASSSSYLSNGSSPPPGLPQAPPLAAGEGWGGGGAAGGSGSSVEAVSLNRLSKNLEQLLLDRDLDCSDADVEVPDGGPPIAVHRCILAARSAFFYDLFAARGRGGAARGDAAATAGGAGEGAGSGRPQYKMDELVPGGRVGREAFQAFLGYLYTGKLWGAPFDVVSCADPVCPHDSCPPAIRFAVEIMYAAWTFKIPELISVFQVRCNFCLLFPLLVGSISSLCRKWFALPWYCSM